MATLDEYKSAMPMVTGIWPDLTKTAIENKLASIPAVPTKPAPAKPTKAAIIALFDEVYGLPTVEEAIAKAGGIMKLAAKHGMTRLDCITILQEFSAVKSLYDQSK
jgi:hypothetical protein